MKLARAALAALVVALGAVGACSSSGSGTPSGTHTTSANPATTSAAGEVSTAGTTGSGSGTLHIAFGVDVTTLNPWMTKSVQTDMSVISQIYQSLTVRGPDLKIEPELATSWKQVNDKTWEFKLKQGVKYADGEVFNASVVKWNIEQVQDPATKARIAPNMANVASVKVVDDDTVDIITKTPDTTMPSLMSYFYFLPPDWTKSHNAAKQAMGTGPYQLSSWKPNSSITLSLNPDYVGDKPAFSTIEYDIIPDASAQVAALQTGAVDIITNFNPDLMDQVKGISGVTAGAIPTARSAFLMMNTTHNRALGNLQVRQALNYAVDKQAIIDSILHGLTVPSTGQPYTKEYLGYNTDLTAYPYDPAKAKSLLAEAGYGSGLSLTLTYPANTYLDADTISQVVQSELQQVGVTVKVQSAPFASWLSDMYAGKIDDMVYLTYAWPTLDGGQLLANFAPGGAQSFWNDQKFGDLLAQANQTGNADARAKLVEQASAEMREQAPFIFLFPQPLTYAYNSSVVRWTPRPDDWVRAFDMTHP